MGFDVPLPDPALISALLRDEIDRVIASVPGADWEGYRWTALYQAGFREFFTNLRDVRRFFGALSFTLPMMQQDVDPVDFVGLEALRVFVPDVYAEDGASKILLSQIIRPFKDESKHPGRCAIFGCLEERA